jgi:hypothetical protein
MLDVLKKGKRQHASRHLGPEQRRAGRPLHRGHDLF